MPLHQVWVRFVPSAIVFEGLPPRPPPPPLLPSAPPLPPAVRCGAGCVRGPVPQAECPSNANLPRCDQVGLGEYCEADGECATDANADNCQRWDVYQIVECYGWPPHVPPPEPPLAPPPPPPQSAPVTLDGFCSARAGLNGLWEYVGATRSGAPFFARTVSFGGLGFTLYYLYWDLACDGVAVTPMWIIDTDAPSQLAASDLDGDVECSYLARIVSADHAHPPRGQQLWRVVCDGVWDDWTIRLLTDGADSPPPPRTPPLAPPAAPSPEQPPAPSIRAEPARQEGPAPSPSTATVVGAAAAGAGGMALVLLLAGAVYAYVVRRAGKRARSRDERPVMAAPLGGVAMVAVSSTSPSATDPLPSQPHYTAPSVTYNVEKSDPTPYTAPSVV